MTAHRFRTLILLLAGLVAATPPMAGGWWSRRPANTPPRPDLARLEPLLRPHRIDSVTLSRDGRQLAYAVTDGGAAIVEVRSVDAPDQRQRFGLGDLHGARLLELVWTSDQDLVVALESGVILGLQLDTGNVRTLLTPRTFARNEVLPPTLTAPAEASLEPDWITIPRWPRLLHASGEVNLIYVEGVAGTSLSDATAEIVRLDVRRGTWESVDSIRIHSPSTRAYADRTGHYRLIEDRSRLPLRWQVRPDPGRRRGGWRRLEQVFTKEAQAGFAVARDALLADRSFPLGFGGESDVLYYASNLGRATFAAYAVNVATGERTPFVVEDASGDVAWPVDDLRTPPVGERTQEWWQHNTATFYTGVLPASARSPLVLDRAGGGLLGLRAPDEGPDRWIHPVFQDVQANLDQWFPGRRVRLLDADDHHERFAVHVSAPNDPGRYFVYERSTRRCVEHLRRAPDLPPDRIHPVEAFSFPVQPGLVLRGRLTTPRAARVQPAPLVCLFIGGPWLQEGNAFGRSSQLLAELGCRVLELDHPLGNRGLQVAVDPTARAAPELLAGQAWEAALKWIEEHRGTPSRRVVAMGIGYGGWLALRVAQLHPQRFRGVVTFNAFDSPEALLVQLHERELPDAGSAGLAAAKEAIAYSDALRDDFTRGRASTPEDEGGRANDPFGHSRLRFAKRQLHPVERPLVPLLAELARAEFAAALAEVRAHTVSTSASRLACPVLLIHDAAHPYWPLRDARRLEHRLRATQPAVELLVVPPPRWDRSLPERPEVWPRIAEWLHEVLYRYEVEVGEAREVQR